MKRNAALLLFGLALTALFVLMQVVFTLRQGEVAVVTTFGKPVRALTEPGLYTRWPWPAQHVYRYDNRVRSLDGSLEEVLTQDSKNILVALYTGWRIHDPVKFLERVGTVEQAEINLDGLVRTYKNAAIGKYKFSNFINVNRDELRLEQIEQQVLASVQPDALDRYGIEVLFVGVRRIGLPEAITQSVFERMRAERQEIADRYASEGEGEAIKIRAEADSSREKLLAQAEADAQRLRADGDAAAAAHYEVFAKDPELAMFLRKLEALETTLKDKATVILSSDSEPFDLLRGGDAALPESRKSAVK